MSKTTKRKHVMKEILWDDFELPKENQSVVKVVSSKGNNLHEVSSVLLKTYIKSDFKRRTIYPHLIPLSRL